jgi:Fe-Mn family superoxide dismutase
MPEPAVRMRPAQRGYQPPYLRPGLATDEQGNERVAVTLFSELSSEHMIFSAACQPEYATLFRQGAPHWNNGFQWKPVGPRCSSPEAPALQELLQEILGSPDARTGAPAPCGAPSSSHRWTWLALDGVRLKVDSRHRRGLRHHDESRNGLGIEAWNAAYFLDFRNQSRSCLQRVLDRLVHWRFSMVRAGAA